MTGQMADLVAAIEGLDYECSPESFVMTSAERETCLTTSSISLVAYVWADEETFDAEVDAEVRCSTDSSLGDLRSVRGATWAVAVVPLNGSTAEYSDEVDALLTSVQAALGGDAVSSPCT